MRVLLATDVHVPPSPPILGTILEAARASMPDAVIVSGDLTDSGNLGGDMERLFRKLRRAWEGARLIAVLGNHDLWSRDGDAYSKIERAGGRLAERLGVELLDVVGRAELGGTTTWWATWVGTTTPSPPAMGGGGLPKLQPLWLRQGVDQGELHGRVQLLRLPPRLVQ